LADSAQRTGALLLATKYHVSALRSLAERLRTMRNVTEQVLSLRPSPAARTHHQRAARALAEAELALWVVEGVPSDLL
jgi:hypothetical protein